MQIPKITVDSVRPVYNDGNHNAFTDLCCFRDEYYLTFRSCPGGHGILATSSIKVLKSRDTREWEPVFTYSVPQRDVRDPHFLVFRDTLFVYAGTWLTNSDGTPVRDLNEHQGYCAWSSDGEKWNGPRYLVGTQSHYIWRAAAYGSGDNAFAYLCGRRKKMFAEAGAHDDARDIIEAALLRSPDGFNWEAVGLLQETYGNETAFIFETDGSLLAVARRIDNDTLPAEVCRSSAPYRRWKRTNLDRNVGGPMLEKWGERYLVGGRNTLVSGKPVTALYWLADDRLVEAAVLPSGGDNSYPGFVALSPQKGLLSYYSSHEGSGTSLAPCGIYLAELSSE